MSFNTIPYHNYQGHHHFYKNHPSPSFHLPPHHFTKKRPNNYRELIEGYSKPINFTPPHLMSNNLPTYDGHSMQRHHIPQKEIPSLNGYNVTYLNKLEISIRFAVNGLSKSAPVGPNLPSNTNIQDCDFGDDSGMIAENQSSIVIGLADGAGGNRRNGIDPKVFSRSLLGYCVENVKNETIKPNEMAKLACKSIHSMESKNILGSGTLCLLSIDKSTNQMYSLNMGDSGFTLIRNGRIAHKSNPTMSGSSPKQFYVSPSNYTGIIFVNEKYSLVNSFLNFI